MTNRNPEPFYTVHKTIRCSEWTKSCCKYYEVSGLLHSYFKASTPFKQMARSIREIQSVSDRHETTYSMVFSLEEWAWICDLAKELKTTKQQIILRILAYCLATCDLFPSGFKPNKAIVLSPS